MRSHDRLRSNAHVFAAVLFAIALVLAPGSTASAGEVECDPEAVIYDSHGTSRPRCGWSMSVNGEEVARGPLAIDADGNVSLVGEANVEGRGFTARIDGVSGQVTPGAEIVFGVGATNNSNAVATFAFAFNLPLGGLEAPLTTFAELGTTLTAPSDAPASVSPPLGFPKIVDSQDIRFDPFENIDEGVDLGAPLTADAATTALRIEQATGSIDSGGPFDLLNVTIAFALTDQGTAATGVGFSGRVHRRPRTWRPSMS